MHRFRRGTKSRFVRIEPEEAVHRYGNVIGFATRPFSRGDHVHVHNLGYKELDHFGSHSVTVDAKFNAHVEKRTFLGYQRADGRVGTRNYIAVVAASNCAAYTSELIAQSFASDAALPPNIDGIVAFPHGEGCGHSHRARTRNSCSERSRACWIIRTSQRRLILGLGCEVNQIDHYLGRNAHWHDVGRLCRA